MKPKLLLLSSILFTKLLASTYIIDEPGVYNLGQNLIEIGSNVVEITVSDVTLDLNENTIAGGTNGIVVDPGLSFVTIRNGRIASIVSDGICIGANCTNTIIDNLTIVQCGNNAITVNNGMNGAIFSNTLIGLMGNAGISIGAGSASMKMDEISISNCSGSAIELLGTSTGDQVKNLLLENITTASCALLQTVTHVIRVDYGDNIIFNALSIFTSGNALNDNILVGFRNCIDSNIRRALLSTNCAGSLVGVSLNQTESSILQNVIFINNTTNSGDLDGFLLTNTSSNNLISLCSVGTSSATDGHARGYNVTDISDGIVFDGCSVASLIGADVTGFDFHFDQLGLHNVLAECNVLRNFALTGTCVGYSINNANCGTLRDSFGSYNQAPSGLAAGLLFTGTGGQEWNISNNTFVGNVGLDDANSFGIFVETGTNNLFLQNVAFNNGNIANNQMDGVPAGSVTQLNPNNLNTADTPWGNVVITI